MAEVLAGKNGVETALVGSETPLSGRVQLSGVLVGTKGIDVVSLVSSTGTQGNQQPLKGISLFGRRGDIPPGRSRWSLR